MGDGAVRFVRDGVDSWPVDPRTGLAVGMVRTATAWSHVPRAGRLAVAGHAGRGRDHRGRCLLSWVGLQEKPDLTAATACPGFGRPNKMVGRGESPSDRSLLGLRRDRPADRVSVDRGLMDGFHLFEPSIGLGTQVLLVLALLTAFGFEFVNGFHDTANAVATVIYTKSLGPKKAVVWSGFCNFLGVTVGGTAVAFGIISLLPTELIVSVDSARGLAMVMALLISAIAWNLGTWFLGIPASSSHTLIGSILGVGLANSLLPGHKFGVGVNWTKAGEVGLSLLISPLVGFACAALLLVTLKRLVTTPELYQPPEGDKPPPPWIRGDLAVDLHRGQPGARVERRPEGDRPGDADPDRRVARALRPRLAGPPRPPPHGSSAHRHQRGRGSDPRPRPIGRGPNQEAGRDCQPPGEPAHEGELQGCPRGRSAGNSGPT